MAPDLAAHEEAPVSKLQTPKMSSRTQPRSAPSGSNARARGDGRPVGGHLEDEREQPT